MTNTIVIYYSRDGYNYVNGKIVFLEKGNTECVVEMISAYTPVDIFRIEPCKEYDSDYTKCTQQTKQELQKQARPELKEYLPSIDSYENIIIAGPCWWSTYPMCVFSQLEKLNFQDKKIFPIMTHEGSGLGSSITDLSKVCPGAHIQKGFAIHGSDVMYAKDMIEKWVDTNIKR